MQRELITSFLCFVDCKNISQAAEKLHVTQPAVTAQLKAFEKGFPFPLFHFQGKRKVLTHYGNEIYHMLKENESLLRHRLEHINSSYRKEEDLKLVIGARKELFSRLVLKTEFKGQLHFKPLTGAEALRQLHNHGVDIVVTERESQYTEFVMKKTFSDHSLLVVHNDLLDGRPLSAQLAKSKKFLCNTPYLAYRREDPPFIREWLSQTEVPLEDLKARLICDDWDLIARMVEQRKGFSVIPSEIPFDRESVAVLNISKKLIPASQFYIYYHSDLTNIEPFRQFIQRLAGMR